MQEQRKVVDVISELAEDGVSVEQMTQQTERSLTAVTNALVRWLRCSGQTDVTAWVKPEVANPVRAARKRETPPTMTQLANDLQIELWQIQVVAAADWNAAHPVAELPDVPIQTDGGPDVTAMLAARWSMPLLVRATGLHPATLEDRVAEFLAAQTEPDATPWLTDDEIAQVSTLLDGPSPYFNLRRAQARGETTRGKVAIVRALRGQWQPKPPPSPGQRRGKHGKTWSRAEDMVLRAGLKAGMAHEELAEALERSEQAVLLRAAYLTPTTAPNSKPVGV